MNVRHSPILEALLPWRIIAFLAPLLLLLAPIAIARSQSSLQQGADSSPFRPLDLPTPTDVRSGSGRPGAKYWQQRVDYKIAATLDPARNELRGRETIHYINRSPDALPYLWLFVEQNLCAPNSITSQAANKSSFQISTSRTAFTTTGGLAGSASPTDSTTEIWRRVE